MRPDGYPAGLTTVSHRAKAIIVLDALGLRDEFDVIVTIDNVAHAKPDPEMYLPAAKRLHRPPAVCLAIEDSLPGVRAAHSGRDAVHGRRQRFDSGRGARRGAAIRGKS